MKNKLFELNVTNLEKSEKLFLWCIREWLLCIRLAKDPKLSLLKAMHQFNIKEAVLPIDKSMRTLAYYSSLPIDIRCHCSEQVGKSEIDILCILSIKQNQIEFRIEKIIKYLKKEYLIQLNKNFVQLIASFNQQKLFFPMRENLIASYNKINQSKNTVIYFDFKNNTLH